MGGGQSLETGGGQRAAATSGGGVAGGLPAGLDAASGGGGVSDGQHFGTDLLPAGCSSVTGPVPAAWALTVSGVTNDFCTDCSNVNGSHTLYHLGDCVWESSPYITVCTVSTARFRLAKETGQWRLSLYDGLSQHARWFLPEEEFQPMSGNTFSHFDPSTSNACDDYPLSVLLVPVVNAKPNPAGGGGGVAGGDYDNPEP